MERADTLEEMTDDPKRRDEGADYRDLYLRTLADFDNFRKRIDRERDDLANAGRRDLLLEVIGVVDNFERAVDVVEDSGPDGTNESGLAAGVVAIYRQLRRLLERNGVADFESVGHPFDPETQEAVAVAPSNVVPDGVVLEELRPGYTWNGRLIRPARVIVSSGSGS